MHIISLRKIGLLPAEPDKWYCTHEKVWIEVDGSIAWMKDVMEILTIRYADLMWTKVTPGEATGGLEHGTPCLEQAKKCHAHLVRCGKQQQANCLESVVGHTVWNAGRATSVPENAKCRRCGAENETLRHRFYECPANKDIDSEDVRSTESLCTIAKKHWASSDQPSSTEDCCRKNTKPSCQATYHPTTPKASATGISLKTLRRKV